MLKITSIILAVFATGCAIADNPERDDGESPELTDEPVPYITITGIGGDGGVPEEKGEITETGEIYLNGVFVGRIDWEGRLPGYCTGTDTEPIDVERYNVDLSVYDTGGELVGYVEDDTLKNASGSSLYSISGDKVYGLSGEMVASVGNGVVNDNDGNLIARWQGNKDTAAISIYIRYFSKTIELE